MFFCGLNFVFANPFDVSLIGFSRIEKVLKSESKKLLVVGGEGIILILTICWKLKSLQHRRGKIRTCCFFIFKLDSL